MPTKPCAGSTALPPMPSPILPTHSPDPEDAMTKAAQTVAQVSADDALVIFTPSGQGGGVPLGTAGAAGGAAAGGRSRFRLRRARDLFEMPDHAGLWRVSQAWRACL